MNGCGSDCKVASGFVVMAGLVPAIHVFVAERRKTWMPGTRPGMTIERNDLALEMRQIMRERFDFLVAQGIGDIGHGGAGAAGPHA
jgi:hypothetical protein